MDSELSFLCFEIVSLDHVRQTEVRGSWWWVAFIHSGISSSIYEVVSFTVEEGWCLLIDCQFSCFLISSSFFFTTKSQKLLFSGHPFSRPADALSRMQTVTVRAEPVFPAVVSVASGETCSLFLRLHCPFGMGHSFSGVIFSFSTLSIMNWVIYLPIWICICYCLCRVLYLAKCRSGGDFTSSSR